MARRNTVTEDAPTQKARQQGANYASATASSRSDERALGSTVFTFRLPREELAALEKAAAEAGFTVSEYLRKAAAMRPATSILARPQINLSINTPYSQSGTLVTWSEAQANTTECLATMEGPGLARSSGR